MFTTSITLPIQPACQWQPTSSRRERRLGRRWQASPFSAPLDPAPPEADPLVSLHDGGDLFLSFLPLQSFSCQIEPSLPFLVLRGHQDGGEWILLHPASNNKMWSRVILRWSFFTSGCSGGTLMAGHTLWIKIKLVSQSGKVKAGELRGNRSTLTFLSFSCCQNAEEERQFSKIYIAPVNPCWVDKGHH